MKKRKTGLKCSYCGVRDMDSRDHVVPKALFGKPTPQDIITVGVCTRCNHVKSRCDDYLRDCLACDIHVRTNPIVKKLRTGQIARSVMTNRSVLARQAVQYGRLLPMFTPLGLYAGQCVSFPTSTEPLAGALWFIVRGLYYHVSKTILPENYVYAMCPVQPEYGNYSFEHFCNSVPPGQISIGKAVFDAKFIIWSEDAFTTNWCLRFYETLVYYVFVTSSENAQKHLIPNLGINLLPPPPSDMPVIIHPK